ncbi:DnaJ C-terminal domain-containing protein [Caldimonas manganoxidans]|uniref:DnaJ C-terminal domain-containing protein n=2 Tax=Caldimonas TaxID=196013 RepID=UPI000366E242
MPMAQFKDYYRVLGVPRDATADQIKQAYRRLARKYHPDVSREPDAATRMSEVNEAYAVLSDPQRRAAYDAVGAGRRAGEPFTPPPDWDAGFEFSPDSFEEVDLHDVSDFFAELFGRMGARSRAAGARASVGRGEDHHARIVLDLADAWLGAQKEITLRSPQVDADGRVRLTTRTLQVQIPRGVRPGQLIRLAGQGGAGPGAAAPGDLYLEVQFRPDPRFRLDGNTLITELPVAPWEAALGAVVPLSLPGGQTLRVRVPAGAQSGQHLTVRGQGLPSQPPGDLELIVRVILPSAHHPKARELYEQMAAALPQFDARRQAAADAESGGARS